MMVRQSAWKKEVDIVPQYIVVHVPETAISCEAFILAAAGLLETAYPRVWIPMRSFAFRDECERLWQECILGNVAPDQIEGWKA